MVKQRRRVFLVLLLLLVSPTMCWRKFETVADVPTAFFKENRVIYGFTERVIDGDTIRVSHVGRYRLKSPEPLNQRAIAHCTLSIRIYGVDCPELAKQGHPAQPFADTAKEFTTKFLLHKVVKITLLRKDQYGRAIAAVERLPNWFGRLMPGSSNRRDLSVQLATQGLAELYTSGGAEYWDKREILERKIEHAQRRNIGMWSMGDQRVSAADYKKGKESSSPFRNTTNTYKTSAPPRNNNKKPALVNTNKTKDKRASNLLDTAITGLDVVGG